MRSGSFFLFAAQKHGKFAIHSASILYKEKAWLFSGHSGMGKSTHTQMWHDLLQTPYLNGDLNLLAMENSKIIRPTGFHGAELPGFIRPLIMSLAVSSFSDAIRRKIFFRSCLLQKKSSGLCSA